MFYLVYRQGLRASIITLHAVLPHAEFDAELAAVNGPKPAISADSGAR
jgi:hypothetical protein